MNNNSYLLMVCTLMMFIIVAQPLLAYKAYLVCKLKLLCVITWMEKELYEWMIVALVLLLYLDILRYKRLAYEKNKHYKQVYAKVLPYIHMMDYLMKMNNTMT